MILGRVGGEGERHSPSLESEAAPSRGLAELHVPAKENDARTFSGSLDPGKCSLRHSHERLYGGLPGVIP